MTFQAAPRGALVGSDALACDMPDERGLRVQCTEYDTGRVLVLVTLCKTQRLTPSEHILQVAIEISTHSRDEVDQFMKTLFMLLRTVSVINSRALKKATRQAIKLSGAKLHSMHGYFYNNKQAFCYG